MQPYYPHLSEQLCGKPWGPNASPGKGRARFTDQRATVASRGCNLDIPEQARLAGRRDAEQDVLRPSRSDTTLLAAQDEAPRVRPDRVR